MIASLLFTSVVLAETPARILLNTATAEALAALDEVDETEAGAIVALRSTRGRISNIEELRFLPGMDDPTLASLRSGTVIELTAATGERKQYGSVDEVLAEFSREPSIQAVQAWANEYAQSSPDTVRRWLRQAKSFALLPALDLDYDFDVGFDTGYQYYVVSGLPTPTSPDDELFDALDDASVDQSHGIGVSLSWDLNELVMSSERIRVIGEVQDVVKLRDKTLGEVTRLYFERRRLQADQLLNPKSDLGAQLKEQLKLLEMTANLDAYTGGRFSDALVTPLAAR